MDTPLGVAVTAWLLLGLATLIFKPRSPEAYARLAAQRPTVVFSRVAALTQLLGGLGLDPVKVSVAALKVLTGTTSPAKELPGSLGPYRTPLQGTADSTPGDQMRDASKKAGLMLVLVGGGAILAALLGAEGCTPGARQDARTAIEVAKTACIVAHQFLPDTEVAKVCDVANPLFGPMQDILASSRLASSQALGHPYRGACTGDAGAP